MKSTKNVIEFVKPSFDIEGSLIKMKKLQTKMKEMTAEFDMLKKQSIENYFFENDTYTTIKGLVLATYKSYDCNRFDSTEFKKVNPEMYGKFTVTQKQTRFDLK